MNYIAHLHLSRGIDSYIVGNFIADIISNEEYKLLDEYLRTGIEFHRFIDSYTDNHPLVREINRYFYPVHGKYSPVISDITMDLCLYNSWDVYNEQEFYIFESRVYSVLSAYLDRIPDETAKKVHFLLEQRFLTEYTTEEGLQRTFLRIGQRARFNGNFELAVQTYSDNKEVLSRLFNEFYPQLMEICSVNYPSK